jgi:hypothetical protein
MHRQTLIALSWCLVLGTAIAVLWEVHRSHASPPAPTQVEARAPKIPAPAAQYSGNTNTHKFHRKGCRYYSCPNCTAKFATREEAIRAGYRPCGTCDP